MNNNDVQNMKEGIAMEIYRDIYVYEMMLPDGDSYTADRKASISVEKFNRQFEYLQPKPEDEHI